MTIVVTNISNQTGTAVATVTFTIGAGGVPAGALILITVSDSSIINTNSTCTDTAGNTYTSRHGKTKNNVAANGFANFWESDNSLALVSGNTIVVHVGSATTANISANACYVTGVSNRASGPYNAAVSAETSGSSTTPSVTSNVPATAGQIFFAYAAGTTLIASFTQDSTNATWASPPGSVSNAAPPLGGGNVINNTLSARTYAPTFGTTDTWAAAIIAYESGDVRPQICLM